MPENASFTSSQRETRVRATKAMPATPTSTPRTGTSEESPLRFVRSTSQD